MGRVIDKYKGASPRVRALIVALLVINKMIMTFVVLPMVIRYLFMESASANTRRLGLVGASNNDVLLRGQESKSQPKLRVLYLLTQATRQDTPTHLGNLLTVQMHGLAKTFATVMDLDTYVLLGYELSDRLAAPPGVGLETWDEATMENDEHGDSGNEGNFSAKRQYLVLRDKLMEYDVFISSYLDLPLSTNMEGTTETIGPRQFWAFINAILSHHEDMESSGGVRNGPGKNVRNGTSVVHPAGNFDMMVFSESKQPEPRSSGWIANQAGLLKIFSSDCWGEQFDAGQKIPLKILDGTNATGCENITVINSYL